MLAGATSTTCAREAGIASNIYSTIASKYRKPSSQIDDRKQDLELGNGSVLSASWLCKSSGAASDKKAAAWMRE